MTKALRQDDCKRCTGSGCLDDKSAQLTFEVLHIALPALPEQALASIRSAFAEDIASTLGVSNLSVVDLRGNNASVTIAEDGNVSAFVLAVTDASAIDFATKLYSSTFRSLVINSTKAIVNSQAATAMDSDIAVGAVSIELQRFTPLVPTTTATTTPTITATTTPSTSAQATTHVGTKTSTTTTRIAGEARVPSSNEKDIPSSSDSRNSSSDSGGKKRVAWWWFVVGGAVCGGAVFACALATQRRKSPQEASGSVV